MRKNIFEALTVALEKLTVIQEWNAKWCENPGELNRTVKIVLISLEG